MPFHHVWVLALALVGCGRPLFDGRSAAGGSDIASSSGALPDSTVQTPFVADANLAIVYDSNGTLTAGGGNIVVLSPNQTYVAANCNSVGYPFNTTVAGNANVYAGGRSLDMAIATDGNPVVAYMAPNPNNVPHVYAQRWSGSAWVAYGTSNNWTSGDGISALANTYGVASDLTLALDPCDAPGITWQNYSGSAGRTYYTQWNGTQWTLTQQLGTATVQNNTISQIGVTFVAPQKPLVAFRADSAQGAVLNVWNYTGSGWNTLHPPAPAVGGGVNNPALAAGTSGSPAMLYNNNGGVFGAQLQLSNGTWNPVGPSLVASIGGQAIDQVANQVAVDNSNRIVVAWQDSNRRGISDVYLMRWNGSHWEDLGGSSLDGGVSHSVSGIKQFTLAVDDKGFPAIAWVDLAVQQIFVRHWNGSYWETLGSGKGISGSTMFASGTLTEPRIGFAPDGTMMLAWKYNDYYVTVCKVSP